MPRKANSDNLDGDNSIIGVRVPVDLIKRLDKYVMQRGTNRTIEVTRGIEFLVSSMECPICHTLNSRGSFVCSVCGSPLNRYKDMMNGLIEAYNIIVKSLDSADDMYNESKDRFEKIMWLINRESPLVKSKIMDDIKKYVDKYTYMTEGIPSLINEKRLSINKGVEEAKKDSELISYDYLDEENPAQYEIDNIGMLSYLTEYAKFHPMDIYNTEKFPYDYLQKLESANNKDKLIIIEMVSILELSNSILDIIEALIDNNLPLIKNEVKSIDVNKS